MDKKSINLFKRLLQDHGVNVMFVGFYNQFRYPDNPKNVQEFLEITPRNLAIAYAFDATKISVGNRYGAKFWDDLNKKWQAVCDTIDDRKKMEPVRIVDEEREIKKEEKRVTAFAPVEDNTYPSSKEDEGLLVKHNWAGILDLVDVKMRKATKQMDMPDENEIRVSTRSKNVVVLNAELVKNLSICGANSMTIQVDRKTNRMVMLFGKGLEYTVTDYSNDVKAVQFKPVIEILQRYVGEKFDPNKVYFIKIAERLWNHDHSGYAIVLSTKMTVKDR